MLELRLTTKNATNSAVVAKVILALTIGPQLPAVVRAQMSMTISQMMSMGAQRCSIFFIAPRPLISI